MLTIETKELNINVKLRRKVDIICKFAYVKPHIITINKVDYLMFDECDDIYINGYNKKIKIKDEMMQAKFWQNNVLVIVSVCKQKELHKKKGTFSFTS